MTTEPFDTYHFVLAQVKQTVARPSPTQDRSHCGWNVFFSEHASLGMLRASAIWNAKSPAEQVEYSLRVYVPAEQHIPAPARIDVGEPPPTPWGIGDVSFPLTSAQLDGIQSRASSKQFCAEFGPMVRPGDPINVSTRFTCEDKYGPGACARELLPGAVGRVLSVKDLLDLLCRADETPSDNLRMYWFLPQPVALLPRGFVALLCAAKLARGQQRAAFALWDLESTNDDVALHPGLCCGVSEVLAR
jgi:hypothetical protein